MPYVNIKVTREGVTSAQKAELICGVTDLLVRVLDKSPATTFVVIDEVALEDWGTAGGTVPTRRRELTGTSCPADTDGWCPQQCIHTKSQPKGLRKPEKQTLKLALRRSASSAM